MSLVHTHGDGHPGRGGYSGDQPDRGTQSEQVGGDAGMSPRLQTAGYRKTSTPMRAMPRPDVANRIGYRPQARPSLRLLTSPAWLAADSAGSLTLVRAKIWRPVRPSYGRP